MMNEPQKKSCELNELFRKLCDQQLSASEQVRLNTLLRQDEDARWQYLSYMELHAALHWTGDTDESKSVFSWENILRTPADADVSPSPAPTAKEPTAEGFPISLWRWGNDHLSGPTGIVFFLVLLVAVTLAFAFVSWPFGRNSRREPTAAPVLARLLRTVDCQWAETSAASFLGENLTKGQCLSLEKGLAEIHFNSGAQVILEGPADFEVVSRNSGRLHTGTLTANAPPSAFGFTVWTPSMEAVDLGTEFAVSADETGRSELHVLSGKVQARLCQNGILEQEELVSGQALCVEPTGKRTIDVQLEAFIRALPEISTLPPPLDTTLTWRESPANRPIIPRGPEDAWDHLLADNPFVFVEHDKLYCFYKGRDKPLGLGGMQRIGVATSVDGRHWVKPSNRPVLDIGPPGAWDSEGVKLPSVFHHEGTYYLFYSGLNGKVKQIGMATSTDLLHWTKHPGNPILTVRPERWDCQLSTHPTPVFQRNDRFYLLFRGMKSFYNRQGVGLAFSVDMVHWYRDKQQPVIAPSEEIYSFGAVQTTEGYVAMSHAVGEPYWHSRDLVHWEKGEPARFDQPDVDTVSKPFFWKGKWNVFYERDDLVYRAVLDNTPNQTDEPLGEEK